MRWGLVKFMVRLRACWVLLRGLVSNFFSDPHPPPKLPPQKFMSPQDLSVTKVKKIENNDIIIALVGPSGTGKSTFINVASTKLTQAVGHSLKAETSQIRAVRVLHPKTHVPVVLVDTPGFDDGTMSDIHVLSMIEKWLGSSSKRKAQLSGIIYLHNISSNRNTMSPPSRNTSTFERLCGNSAAEHIILVTTMWEGIKGDAGERRESDLKGKYWNEMLRQGSTTERFYNTFECAWRILDGVTKKCDEPRGTLQLTLGQGKPSVIPLPSGFGKIASIKKLAGLALKVLKS